MFTSIRTSGAAARLSCIALALASIAGIASAQSGSNNGTPTAPQLLPYTAQVIAGGGNTAASVGATCGRTGATPSGNISSDAYGDNCLATEVSSTTLSAGSFGPRYAITDSTGAVYFGDWNNGLLRRIDPQTGIITAIAGGVSASPAGSSTGVTCGTRDPAHTTLPSDVMGDGCLGIAIKFNYLAGMAFSPSGDLYFADRYNYNVRKMSFSNGGVAAVILTSAGTGYTTAPTVTFSAPVGGGTTATGTATISGGVVTGVTITNPGSGYSASAMPTVTFSASGSGVSATGKAVYTGVVTMAAGNLNGGSASAKGFNSGCNAALAPATTFVAATSTAPTPCVVEYPYALAFDTSGDLFISDEYFYAVLVLNTNTTGSTTVQGQTIPAQTMVKIIGSKAAGAACVNGTASSSGCTNGTYTSGMAAGISELYNPYGVALDSSGDIFVADEDYSNVAEASAATPYALNSFAGAYPLTGIGTVEAPSKRAAAGSFTIGSDYSVSLDGNNNVYIPDALAGYIWRVDAPTNSMYVVGGGGTTATTAGSACSATGIGANLIATDTYGDGCPALLATFSHSCSSTSSSVCPTNGYGPTGVWSASPDAYGDLFVGDEGNGLIREIASGTQFGNTGAVATDYIDIHFAAGDTPITASGKTVPFAITSGSTIFTVGTPTCTANSDTTTDCVVPVTASPTVVGPYSGTLTVKSTIVPAGTSFALSGTFTKSPNTRLSLSFASTTTNCGAATTFSNADTVALTATLILSGPAPSGTITFFAQPSGGTATQIGTPQNVVNLGTSASPVYGAVLNYTFATPGSYTISATYSGDTTAPTYYHGSTATTPTNALTFTVPTFTLAATSDGTTNVHGGCPPGEIGQCVITAGQTGLYSVTLTETVYTGTISFSCSGAPANASCVVAPTTLSATGCSTSGTLAVSVITSGGVPAQTAIGLPGSGPWQLLTMAFGIGLALMIGLRRRKLHLRGLWMAVALLLTSSGLLACSNGIANNLPITPKGTYTITVTATGSTGTSSSVALPLTIQ